MKNNNNKFIRKEDREEYKQEDTYDYIINYEDINSLTLQNDDNLEYMFIVVSDKNNFMKKSVCDIFNINKKFSIYENINILNSKNRFKRKITKNNLKYIVIRVWYDTLKRYNIYYLIK